MDSLEIREIEARLTKEINGIQLPLEIKRLILLEIMSKVESAAEQEIGAILESREQERMEQEETEEAERSEVDE